MAPEIREKKTYYGRQVDVFSTGVVLFLLVHGTFPFSMAVHNDKYYSLIKNK